MSLENIGHGIGIHSLTQIALAMDKELTDRILLLIGWAKVADNELFAYTDKELTNTVRLSSWLVAQTGMTNTHTDISHCTDQN